MVFRPVPVGAPQAETWIGAGLRAEHPEATAAGVTGEIDQDVDPVVLDAIRQLLVGQQHRIDPAIRERAELVGHLVLKRR